MSPTLTFLPLNVVSETIGVVAVVAVVLLVVVVDVVVVTTGESATTSSLVVKSLFIIPSKTNGGEIESPFSSCPVITSNLLVTVYVPAFNTLNSAVKNTFSSLKSYGAIKLLPE